MFVVIRWKKMFLMFFSILRAHVRTHGKKQPARTNRAHRLFYVASTLTFPLVTYSIWGGIKLNIGLFTIFAFTIYYFNLGCKITIYL